jgi:hypothetical protein
MDADRVPVGGSGKRRRVMTESSHDWPMDDDSLKSESNF